MATLTAGDTTFASEDYATAVGSMDADAGEAEQDGEFVLKAGVAMGDIDAAVSYILNNASAASGDNTGYGYMSAGASATLGTISAAFTYQSGDAGTYVGAATQDEMMGFKASTTVAGLDVAAGYFTNTTDDKQSLGVSASYAIGEITLAGSYVNETVAGASGDANWDVSAAYDNGTLTAKAFTDESSDWGVEGTYALGNGIALAAGMVDAGDDIYVGGTYDLGGGATLLVSYADDKDADEAAADNDIGAAGYQVGTTVEVSFKF